MSDAPHPAATHVTPYDRLDLGDAAIVRLLASGAQRAALVDYFGAAAYAELAVLARRAAARRDRGGPRVYILPGIMGSQLGKPRGPGLPRDILWLDPIDIAIGRLREIALRPHTPVRAMGVLLYNFLELQLRLVIAGFAPRCFDYDWRRSVIELGREFAAVIARDPAPRVQVVAHSMGGLVARAALALPGNERIERLVMLGTPNSGSFAPVQALRGTYSVVRKLAMLDQFHSAETLANEVYSTFPGLYELLPAEGTTAIDLFDAAMWPAAGPRPDPLLLADARSALRGLAPADERMTLVAGYARRTVTGIARAGAQFAYTVTRDGDGTVPLALAELPGVRTYYIREGHSELTANRTVTAAVIDLLRTGATRRLPDRRPVPSRAAARITDAGLRRVHRGKIDWHDLSPDERRIFLATLNDPPTLTLRAPSARRAPSAPPTRATQRPVARTRRARAVLEIGIIRGDIAAAAADALAVGVYHGVPPAGAAAAIDAQLGGAIAEFAERRMLPGRAGQITALPAAGRLPHAAHVVIVGLGRFADLDAGTIELAADSVARFCERGGLGSIATVPWGAGSGMPATLSFAAQLRGYLRQRGPAGSGLERIVFVVRDAAEHRAIARLAATLAREMDPDGLRIRVHTGVAARARRATPTPAATVPRLAHLLVERTGSDADTETWRAAALTPGEQAAVIAEPKRFARRDLDALLRQLDDERFTAARVTRLGASLAKLVLHPHVLAALAASKSNPLSVVNDVETSRLPWEMLTLGSWSPAIRAGLSRRFAAANLSVARFSERRRSERTLTVLLVVNPTEDLPGAAREGARVRDIFRGLADARLTLVEGAAATRARVLAEFESGDYDVVHYAGHAAFDPGAPRSSGLIVSDGVVTGGDLVSLAQLPALVFFNACESGRVRGARAIPAARRAAGARTSRVAGLAAGVSVAEAWLRAGIANFIGTYWPVGDAAAATCADTFYTALVGGASIGGALLAARHAVQALRSPDWADYLHYGDPQFALKSVDAAAAITRR
ncbi:MAG: CHAT domain-containing protein [Steroidobacteraceae bacterium]